MITINDMNSIKFTYGDKFFITATLKNYTTSTGDVATLAIKESEGDSTVVMTMTGSITTTTSGVVLTFSKTSTEMTALAVGNYVYDISIANTVQGRQTFMFTAPFEVKAVAHNV